MTNVWYFKNNNYFVLVPTINKIHHSISTTPKSMHSSIKSTWHSTLFMFFVPYQTYCQKHMIADLDFTMNKLSNVRYVIGCGAFCSWNSCLIKNYLYKVQVKRHFVITSKHMATTHSLSQREWRPEDIISGTKLKRGYACLVINRRVTVPPEIVEHLWQNAEFRCTVDGGTNRWRHFVQTHEKGEQLKLPDFITGDFDSITQETEEFFNNPSIQRVHTPDQNYTDFTKAILVLEPFLLAKKINDIFVFHDTSGRIDHIMANIQTLYKSTATLNVYLIGGNSITWLLRPGVHSILIPQELVESQRWCSLLPVGGRATVTSKGLKWDLNKGILEFGKGIVSSSNSYSSRTVCIETDHSILWSMGVFNFHDD